MTYGRPLAVEHDVRRLEIAVHDSVSMRVVQCRCDRGDELRRFPSLQSLSLESFCERASFDELFDQIVDARFGTTRSEKKHDARMLELRGASSLVEKALDLLATRQASGSENLDGDGSIELRIACSIDGSERAAAKLLEKSEFIQRARQRLSMRYFRNAAVSFDGRDALHQSCRDFEFGRRRIPVRGAKRFGEPTALLIQGRESAFATIAVFDVPCQGVESLGGHLTSGELSEFRGAGAAGLVETHACFSRSSSKVSTQTRYIPDDTRTRQRGRESSRFEEGRFRTPC